MSEHSSTERLLVGKILKGQKSPVKEVTKHSANIRVIVMEDGTKQTVMTTRLKSIVYAVLRAENSAKLQASGATNFQLHGAYAHAIQRRNATARR